MAIIGGMDTQAYSQTISTMSQFVRTYGDCVTQPSDGSLRLDWIETPLGPMVAAADDSAIRLLVFAERRAMEGRLDALSHTSGRNIAIGTSALIDAVRRQLRDYFAGKLREFSLPIEEPGTQFQTKVWEALERIPYGETMSYAGLAAAVGSPKAVRAVGTANGKNRIAILVPCHRVITTSGALGGYSGSPWRKRALLDLESGHRDG